MGNIPELSKFAQNKDFGSLWKGMPGPRNGLVHSLEVLNVFVCLTDRKPSGEAPVPSRPVSPPHFFLTGSDACSPCCGHPVIRCFSFSVSTSDITKAQTPFITMATMTVREEKHK